MGKEPLYPHVTKRRAGEWTPPTKEDLELVTVHIHRMDYNILQKIADHDHISIAHALSVQFSGRGLYQR